MYTYTFPQEHFYTAMNHLITFSITVETLTLTDGIYTIICDEQIDQDQYNHLHELIELTEIV